jgi:hypothetical protein
LYNGQTTLVINVNDTSRYFLAPLQGNRQLLRPEYHIAHGQNVAVTINECTGTGPFNPEEIDRGVILFNRAMDAHSGWDELLKKFVKAVQWELLLLQMDRWMRVKLPQYTLNVQPM